MERVRGGEENLLAAAIGAGRLPALALPALTAAGTLDRPPLPVTDLDRRAWTVLRWRQDHLPLGQLRRPSDRAALSHLERSAASRLARQLGLGDDQRFSLICHHASAVEQAVASGRPGLSEPRGPADLRRRGDGQAGPAPRIPAPLPQRHSWLPDVVQEPPGRPARPLVQSADYPLLPAGTSAVAALAETGASARMA